MASLSPLFLLCPSTPPTITLKSLDNQREFSIVGGFGRGDNSRGRHTYEQRAKGGARVPPTLRSTHRYTTSPFPYPKGK